jgi:hypothetical protein
MSGIFWEQDRQPNLCEAASGFTFSTLNLLVAIPMVLVDLLVSSLLYVWALLLSILLPLAETTSSGLLVLAELAGITELPALTDLVTPGLAVVLLASVYREHRQGSSCHQLAGKYSLAASGLLWLAALHAAVGFAVAPRLTVVSLALSGASFLPGFFVAMTANFRPAALAASSLLEAASGLANLLMMEAALVVAVAAFGYPELLGGQAAPGEGGELAQYLCAVPFCACVLVYTTLTQPQQPPRGEDQSDGAPTMNGSAVGAALEEAKSSEEPPATDAPEPAPTEEAGETAAPVEDQCENAADESVGAIDDNPPAAADPPADDVTAEPAPDQPVNENAEPEKAPVDEVKENILLAKIKSRLSCVAGGLYGRLLALIGLVTGWLSALAALPWLTISLALTVAGSHLLSAAAWNVLAGSQLAFALPVVTLVLPLTLDRYWYNRHNNR